MCPTEIAVPVWAAQMGTLTFHPWPVRRCDVDHPDELRIDLDPQPGTDAIALLGLDDVGVDAHLCESRHDTCLSGGERPPGERVHALHSATGAVAPIRRRDRASLPEAGRIARRRGPAS
mgnify:CR=1 FL=1